MRDRLLADPSAAQFLQKGDLPVELMGRSVAIMRIQELVRRAAPRDGGALITAEAGAGVESVAPGLALRRPPSPAPYVGVDSAALSSAGCRRRGSICRRCAIAQPMCRRSRRVCSTRRARRPVDRRRAFRKRRWRSWARSPGPATLPSSARRSSASSPSSAPTSCRSSICCRRCRSTARRRRSRRPAIFAKHGCDSSETTSPPCCSITNGAWRRPPGRWGFSVQTCTGKRASSGFRSRGHRSKETNDMGTKQIVIAAALIVRFAAVAAAAQLPAQPRPSTPAAPPPDFVITNPDGSVRGQKPATSPETYVIGPQDNLSIIVTDENDLTGKYRVDTDGTISMPYLQRVPVAGLSLAEAQAKITQLLQKDYIRNPQVRVEVDQFKARSVIVNGEVRTPGKDSLPGT